MPFNSAELKVAYEQLHAAGIGLSAQDAGRMFRDGTLAGLVQEVIGYTADIKRRKTDLRLLEAQIARKEASILGQTFTERQLLGERVYVLDKIAEASAIIEENLPAVARLDNLYVYNAYLLNTIVWIDQQMRMLLSEPASWNVLAGMRTQYEGWATVSAETIQRTEALRDLVNRSTSSLANWEAELVIVERQLWALGTDARQTMLELDGLYADREYLIAIIKATEDASRMSVDRWTQ